MPSSRCECPHALCTPLNEALPIAFLMFMAYLGSLPDHVWRTRVGLIHLFISDSNCLRSSMTFVWFISISNESITFWKHLTSRKPHVRLWGIFFLFSIPSVLAALLGYWGLDWTSLLWPQWRKEPIPSATGACRLLSCYSTSIIICVEYRQEDEQRAY